MCAGGSGAVRRRFLVKNQLRRWSTRVDTGPDWIPAAVFGAATNPYTTGNLVGFHAQLLDGNSLLEGQARPAE